MATIKGALVMENPTRMAMEKDTSLRCTLIKDGAVINPSHLNIQKLEVHVEDRAIEAKPQLFDDIIFFEKLEVSLPPGKDDDHPSRVHLRLFIECESEVGDVLVEMEAGGPANFNPRTGQLRPEIQENEALLAERIGTNRGKVEQKVEKTAEASAEARGEHLGEFHKILEKMEKHEHEKGEHTILWEDLESRRYIIRLWLDLQYLTNYHATTFSALQQHDDERFKLVGHILYAVIKHHLELAKTPPKERPVSVKQMTQNEQPDEFRDMVRLELEEGDGGDDDPHSLEKLMKNYNADQLLNALRWVAGELDKIEQELGNIQTLRRKKS